MPSVTLAGLQVMRLTTRALIIFMALFIMASCSGGKGKVRMDSLKYPVSNTAFLYGEQYEVLHRGAELEVVGKFRQVTRLWSTLWGYLKISGTKEVGDSINVKVARARGEGVVNLSVRSSSCGLNDFYQYTWNILNIIPIMPGCVKVTLKGDIVRRRGVNAMEQATPR